MPKYPDETLGEIKSRIRLSDLIGKTVKLKRAGGHDFKGLSPFSNEKTPSFYVHDDRGFYKCFSTQKGGDAFTWLMESQRMSFTEAVEHLAELAGVVLREPTPEERAAAADRMRMLAALSWAQDYFMRALFWSDAPPAHAAREYVTSRGFKTNSQVTDAGLGWAPLGQALLVALRDAGHTLETAIECGLAVRREAGVVAMFRDRITLPIHDGAGRVIGFTARALRDDQQPKYLNTPDTPLFNKGAELFGLHDARRRLAKVADLHVVEGCFDVLAMRRAGFACCAPLGTALTVAQLELLWRSVESPILCFDGDAAGLRAGRRSAERALPLLRAGRALRFMHLPPGQDPDSLLAGGGVLPEPVSHFAVIWDWLADGLDLAEPSDRGRFRERGRHMLESIADRYVAREWSRAMRVRFGSQVVQAPPIPTEAAFPQRQARTNEARREARAKLDEPEATAAVLLAALLDQPARIEAHIETLAGLPCGRFTPLRDWLLDDEGAQVGLLSPWAVDQMAELKALGVAPGHYEAQGWERVARALAVRYPPK